MASRAKRLAEGGIPEERRRVNPAKRATVAYRLPNSPGEGDALTTPPRTDDASKRRRVLEWDANPKNGFIDLVEELFWDGIILTEEYNNHPARGTFTVMERDGMTG
jgi:hypothetical protein